MNPRTGVTLTELVVGLLLTAILMSLALPPLGRWRDRAAVRSATAELAGTVAMTRLIAVGRGGAQLVADPSTDRIWIRDRDGRTSALVDLGHHYGVDLETGGGTVVLSYDVVGIGRLTSRTLRLRRGRAEGGVTVSAYGRYRRW